LKVKNEMSLFLIFGSSDAHEGIRAALKAVFNATPWQRC
jgi:putative transposase